MQNSHSDVQQSSYRCINHGTHITGQSSKRFQGAASGFGHWGQRPWEQVPPACTLLPAGTKPGKGKQFQGKGRSALQPLRLLTVPEQRARAGGHRYHRDTALLTPPYSIKGFFVTGKKKKSPSKNRNKYQG